jgi:hypothetical protein
MFHFSIFLWFWATRSSADWNSFQIRERMLSPVFFRRWSIDLHDEETQELRRKTIYNNISILRPSIMSTLVNCHLILVGWLSRVLASHSWSCHITGCNLHSMWASHTWGPQGSEAVKLCLTFLKQDPARWCRQSACQHSSLLENHYRTYRYRVKGMQMLQTKCF